MYACYKNIEILHSQISNQNVLFYEFLRLVGMGPKETEKYENENVWEKKKVYLNRQLEKLSRWIFTFDPNDASMDTNDDNDK